MQYDDRNIVLFGCQMIGDARSDHSLSAGNDLQCSRETLTFESILEKIYEFADLERNYIVAKRKYVKISSSSMDEITREIGIEKSDLQAVYYCALDCAFLASLISSNNWRSTLLKYHDSCLGYLQANHFHYYLTGIYFWETFRLQTISILFHCVSRQVIPMFHYCCDCLNNDTCNHSCCKVWLEAACKKAGVHYVSSV